MITMGPHASRNARAIVAAASIAGVALAAVGACTLYSTGLGDIGGDASIVPPEHDAGSFDAPVVLISDANEAAADVIVPNGPDGCAPLETNCLDGIDNDCNGKTDCADPACGAGYTCVPSAANGWSGYALYDDGRGAPCPSSYPTQVDTYEGIIFSPASCAACVCTPSGVACGTTNVACGATCGVTNDAVGTSCVDFGDAITIDGTSSCSASVPTTTGGSCASSGGGATIPPVSFSKLSRTCVATGGAGGGCAAGNSCVAVAPTGTHGACVSQAIIGSVLCPSGYPHANVVMPTSTSFTDTRACTSCSCTGPNGASCAGSVTLDPALDCAAAGFGAAPITFAANGACNPDLVDAATSFLSGSLQATVTSQGSCATDGGAPTGSVTPANQTAYCCQN
jgi:hypothetical protein